MADKLIRSCPGGHSLHFIAARAPLLSSLLFKAITLHTLPHSLPHTDTLSLSSSIQPFFLSYLFPSPAIPSLSPSPTSASFFTICRHSLSALTTLAARSAIFPFRAGHVSLGLACPNLILPAICPSSHSAASMGLAERAALFVGFCQLLCAIIRQRSRYVRYSMALLLQSLRCMLSLLSPSSPFFSSSPPSSSSHILPSSPSFSSILPPPPPQRDYNEATAASCALWLRRVYDEVSEQRTTLSRICSLLLADYIIAITTTTTVTTSTVTAPSASSFTTAAAASSPFTNPTFNSSPGAAQLGKQQQQQIIGLPSSVEAALEPAAFALMDACTPHDLQFLHMALGSGHSRRAALARLKQTYDESFKYEGKV